MKFGFYDDANKEYVITSPKTPYPWINYLGTQDFFGLISNTAGGYNFYKDARLARITRYRYNNVPADAGGRYFYICISNGYGQQAVFVLSSRRLIQLRCQFYSGNWCKPD